MITPISINADRTTNDLYFQCEQCKLSGTLHCENMQIKTDREGRELVRLVFTCLRCGNILE